MNKHELIEQIKALPSRRSLEIYSKTEYNTIEADIDTDDLKSFAIDYERLVRAAGDLLAELNQLHGYLKGQEGGQCSGCWYCNHERVAALRAALEGHLWRRF